LLLVIVLVGKQQQAHKFVHWNVLWAFCVESANFDGWDNICIPRLKPTRIITAQMWIFSGTFSTEDFPRNQKQITDNKLHRKVQPLETFHTISFVQLSLQIVNEFVKVKRLQQKVSGLNRRFTELSFMYHHLTYLELIPCLITKLLFQENMPIKWRRVLILLLLNVLTFY